MSGFSTPCSSMFILPIRSIVLSKSKPWNMSPWKCFFSLASRRTSGCFSRRYPPLTLTAKQCNQVHCRPLACGKNVDGSSQDSSHPEHCLNMWQNAMAPANCQLFAVGGLRPQMNNGIEPFKPPQSASGRIVCGDRRNTNCENLIKLWKWSREQTSKF